jgi:hypothetical protein
MNPRKAGLDVPAFALRQGDDVFIATVAGGLRGTIVSAGGGTLGIRVQDGERILVRTVELREIFKARRFA